MHRFSSWIQKAVLPNKSKLIDLTRGDIMPLFVKTALNRFSSRIELQDAKIVPRYIITSPHIYNGGLIREDAVFPDEGNEFKYELYHTPRSNNIEDSVLGILKDGYYMDSTKVHDPRGLAIHLSGNTRWATNWNTYGCVVLNRCDISMFSVWKNTNMYPCMFRGGLGHIDYTFTNNDDIFPYMALWFDIQGDRNKWHNCSLKNSDRVYQRLDNPDKRDIVNNNMELIQFLKEMQTSDLTRILLKNIIFRPDPEYGLRPFVLNCPDTPGALKCGKVLLDNPELHEIIDIFGHLKQSDVHVYSQPVLDVLKQIGIMDIRIPKSTPIENTHFSRGINMGISAGFVSPI